MANPTAIPYARVTQGESYTPGFIFEDADGVALSLIVAGRTASFRMWPRDSEAAAVTKTTAGAGEAAWITDGSDGAVRFLFSSADTLALATGTYEVEAMYVDTAPTPNVKVVKGRGFIDIVAPEYTGAL